MSENSLQPNTGLLWAFCAAASHGVPCESWPEHRRRLEEKYSIIEAQLAALPDAMAVGKTVATAQETGQMSVNGKTWERVDTDPFVYDRYKVSWDRQGFGDFYYTSDPLVRDNKQREKEDCRRATIEAYKAKGIPLERVSIYFDSIPDEWNGKR